MGALTCQTWHATSPRRASPSVRAKGTRRQEAALKLRRKKRERERGRTGGRAALHLDQQMTDNTALPIFHGPLFDDRTWDAQHIHYPEPPQAGASITLAPGREQDGRGGPRGLPTCHIITAPHPSYPACKQSAEASVPRAPAPTGINPPGVCVVGGGGYPEDGLHGPALQARTWLLPSLRKL